MLVKELSHRSKSKKITRYKGVLGARYYFKPELALHYIVRYRPYMGPLSMWAPIKLFL